MPRPIPLHERPVPRRVIAVTLACVLVTAGAAALVQGRVEPGPTWLAAVLGLALPGALLAAWWLVRPLFEVIRTLDLAMTALIERDYGLRVDALRSQELGILAARFNVLAAQLRREHSDRYQREMLVETLVEAAPMAIVLTDEAEVVLFANAVARDLFRQGRALDGLVFPEVLAVSAPELEPALHAPRDAIVTLEREGHRETFHLARRYFELSTQQHTLHLFHPLTGELERQEVEVWKKTIRVLNHELNNSLAPITSLAVSARHIAARPELAHRLDEVLRTIEARARHLAAFLDGYARFARLPAPSSRPVPWSEFLAGLEGQRGFRPPASLPDDPGWFDPAQLQQVLINLLKNAVEAGSPPGEVELTIARTPQGGLRFEVLDRGQAMTDEGMRKALLPFYSTRPEGTGLGLPLCREVIEAHGGQLTIGRREGGGTVVTLLLPPPEPAQRAAAGSKASDAELMQ
jgi:two-component system nitrogen regulation sensor histidine kinase NtrY